MRKIAKLTLVALAMLVATPLVACDNQGEQTPEISQNEVSITLDANEGGEAKYANTEYKIGDTLTIRVSPNKGYDIAYVKVNDVEIRPTRNAYRYEITSNTVNIKVKFEKIGVDMSDFEFQFDDVNKTAAIITYDPDNRRIPYPFIVPETVTSTANNVTYKINKILQTAFTSSNVEAIEISKNIEEIELETFMSAHGLTSIEVNPNNPIFASYDHCLYSKDFKNLIAVPCEYLENTLTVKDGTNVIKESAFMNNRLIEKVVLPNSVRTLEAKCFMKMANLKDITFSNQIKTIPNKAFENDNNLVSVTIPEGITTIEEQAFYFCTELSSVKFPKSLKTIGKEAFYRCQKLANPILNEGLEVIQKSAFGSCISIVEITMPSTLRRLEEAVFEGCTNLLKLKLNQGLQYLGGAVCVLTPYIEELFIPNTVTTISYNPFMGTGNGSLILEEGNPNYTMQDGILYTKDLKTIVCVPYNFVGTNYEFVIPSHVEELGYNAFAFNFNLKKITIPVSVKKVNASFESNVPNGSDNTFGLELIYEGTKAQFMQIDTSNKKFDYLAHFKFNSVKCSDGRIMFPQD